jgi:hypothetical protein
MITIETNAIVTEQGELTVRVNVPAEVPPGEHPLVLVIAENTNPQAELTGEFIVHQAGITQATLTFRREDL